MRVLFTMLISSDLGPVSRAVPIARELTRRGHEVVFSNPSAVPAKIIAQAGFDNLPFKPSVSPKIWPEFSPRIWHVNHGMTTEGFLDSDYIRGVVCDHMTQMESVRPDVVVDIWNMRACIAAQALGIPRRAARMHLLRMGYGAISSPGFFPVNSGRFPYVPNFARDIVKPTKRSLFHLQRRCIQMETSSLARRAGMIGMAGAVLWIISVLLEYTFGLYPPDGSDPLYVINQVLALAALVAIAVGILGILWGGGVAGKVGKSGVWLFVIGYGLIVIGGIAALVVRSDDSPLFLVFPIGGLLMDLGALITGISVARAKQWEGWQRWMPLVYAAYLWLAIEIPFIIGVYPDGPGMVPEIFQGAGLFLVALAVYTARPHVSAASLSTA